MTIVLDNARNDRLATDMVPQAAALAVAVADGDRDTITRVLTRLETRELYALAVVLAAHVNTELPLQPVTIAGDPLEAARHAASLFRVTVDDITGPGRRREVIDARHVAAYVAYLLGRSYSEIGRAFEKDHTSVMNGVARVGQTPTLREAANRIAARMGFDRAVEEATA